MEVLAVLTLGAKSLYPKVDPMVAMVVGVDMFT
jgi:hypothetical protein